MERIRLDLEGVTLNDDKQRLTATFRYRTKAGIIVNLPESADVTLRWEDLDDCRVDLQSGEVRLRFKSEAIEKHRWLHGSKELRGQWLDRIELDEAP